MNSVIIYTIRRRSQSNVTMSEGQPQGHGKGEGQSSKNKHYERQIYVMLLLVTFGFLILVTAVYVMLFYINFFQGTTPYFFAGYHLFYQVGEKTMYTNHGINFFLYVISGQKFRADLVKLSSCIAVQRKDNVQVITTSVT